MKRFPTVPALLALLALVFIYFYLSLLDYAKTLENENTTLNDTLIQTQEDLDNEKELSASLAFELDKTKQTLAKTNTSLNTCYSDLSHETELYENCTARNEELAELLFETKEEFENLSDELEGFQDQLELSMSWFVSNSNIENLSARIKYLLDRCTSKEEINAACIPVVMKEEDRWSYKTEEGDRLLSLEETVSHKGGDCEDWSLFFKAAYNFLKQENGEEKTIISAVPGSGIFEIYDEWIYPDAVEKEVGTTEDYVYVICYDSHCVVAISGKEIKNSSDVYKLEGAPAVEPQNGQYVFTIGEGSAPRICSPEICPPSNYTYPDIWLIITDDDIYDFHYNFRWVGYKDYYNDVVYYKNRTDSIISLVEETAD